MKLSIKSLRDRRAKNHVAMVTKELHLTKHHPPPFNDTQRFKTLSSNFRKQQLPFKHLKDSIVQVAKELNFDKDKFTKLFDVTSK